MWKLNRPVLLPEWREAVSRFLAEYPPDTHIRTETERWELFKNEQQEAYKAIRTALEQNQQGLCAFCETALSDTNRQLEHFIPKMLTSPLEELYKRYDNQPFPAALSSVPARSASLNLSCAFPHDSVPAGDFDTPLRIA